MRLKRIEVLSWRALWRATGQETRDFGVSLVILRRVFEPGDLVAEGVLETDQGVLQARRGGALSETHLMLGDLQHLKHSVFVIAGECECILIWHNRKDSGGA